MKKLLLTTALFASIANAQFINTEYTDAFSEAHYIQSALVADIAQRNGMPSGAALQLACTGNTLLLSMANRDGNINTLDLETLQIKILPDAPFKTDAIVDRGEFVLFNIGNIEALSNAEMRVEHYDNDRRWVYVFKFPDLETATAYEACKAQN